MVKRSRKRKVAAMVILGMLALSLLGGCSSSSRNPSIEEIGEKIGQAIDLSTMVKGDKEKLEKLYDIDSNIVEEFMLYTAPTNIKADEILILKLKDDDQLKDVEAKIIQRIEEQSKNFKDYLPDEYFLIENHGLEKKGNYILFVISEEAEKIENIFKEAFK